MAFPMRGAALSLVGLGFLAGHARAEERLAPLEQRLVERVAAREAETLVLIERAVNTNSGTMNFAGVRQVGDLFRGPLEGLGFTVSWVDGAAFGRAGHLVARRPGRGPQVLLIGHLDTVFEGDSPFQRFERIDEATARGPGIIDMKGGNAILVAALGALRDVGALDRLGASVILTGDEEKMGEPVERARADLLALADAADIALGFENAANDPKTAVVARRGSTRWRLLVEARPAHSSQIFRPEVGPGAIFELARVLDGFREELSGERYLSFSPGLVLGGTTVEHDVEAARGSAFGKSNVIPARAEAMGDLRALSPEQLESARSRMQAIAARSLPHAAARVEFAESYPPLAPAAGSARLLALLDTVSRDLGHGAVRPVDPGRAGAADISFTAGRVEMTLDGLGLLGSGDHTVEERADLRTLAVQTRRAALLLLRLAQGALATPRGVTLDLRTYPDGQLELSAERDTGGRFHGRVLAYFPGGEPAEESSWRHGRILRGRCWRVDGTLESEVIDGTGWRRLLLEGGRPGGREYFERGKRVREEPGPR